MKNILAFDFMIRTNRRSYHCDQWYPEPHLKRYYSVLGMQGIKRYRGHVFTVNHYDGHYGRGGMDEGSPPGVDIYRVDYSKDKKRKQQSIRT